MESRAKIIIWITKELILDSLNLSEKVCFELSYWLKYIYWISIIFSEEIILDFINFNKIF